MMAAMTNEQKIAQLRARRQEAMDELEDLVAGGGDDVRKEALADEINRLSDQLEALGNDDAQGS